MNLFTVSYAYDGAPPASSDIVFVADTSGSLEQSDSERYLKDALKLGVDLAPENSRVAILSVSTGNILESDFADVSVVENRESIKTYIDDVTYSNDTDFIAGLVRATELLQAGSASNKRIVLLGDFNEGGYNGGDEQGTIAALDNLAAEAKNGEITVDLVMWGDAPEDSAIASKLLTLSRDTGGELYKLLNPSGAAASIEDIYFGNYEYLSTALSVRGQAGQTFEIPMPTSNVRRARVYVSAQNPASEFGVSYSGASLDGEQNRSYSMVDLNNPLESGVNLSLTPGASGSATVYTILEYGVLELSVSAANEIEEQEIAGNAGNETQKTTIHAEIVDAETGESLLPAPYPDGVSYSVKINSPNGILPVTYNPEIPTDYVFSLERSEEFGEYQVTAELMVGELTFGPLAESVNIPDIRPAPEPPPNWPLIIAIAVGCALVLGGLVVAFRIRRKEVEYQGAAEMASDYQFHGKLSVYAVMLDGGEREIRPFDFGLHLVGEKKITLRNILDSVNARDTYPGAENILFLVGPEESVIVRNNSQATIRMMGRNYESRSKAQLFYDQKCYIVFGKDENELEIVYRKVKEESSQPIHYSFSSRKAQSHIL